MNAFDSFLSKSFADLIKKNLGIRTYEKIEKLIEKRYDLSMVGAISDFEKIYSVLNELFTIGADAIIQDWIHSFASYDKNDKSIMVHDKTISNLILNTFGNTYKKIILQNAYYSDIIPNIIEHSKIPRATGYRLAKDLIKDRLLVKDDNIVINGKAMSKYVSLFNYVMIHVYPTTTITKIKVTKKHADNSYILQMIICR